MSEPRLNDADAFRDPGRRRLSPSDRRPAAGDASLRWGQLPPIRGIVLVAGGAGLGALLTIITRSDPGLLLGILVVVSTVAGSLAVSARRAYLIIPAPALAYLVAASLSGLIHDRAADTSRTLLAINAGRWFAGGFLAMTAATSLAVVIAVARWLHASPGKGARQQEAGPSWHTPPRRSQHERQSRGPGRRQPPQ